MVERAVASALAHAVLVAYVLPWLVLAAFGLYWLVSLLRALGRAPSVARAPMERRGEPSEWPFVSIQVAVCGEGALAQRAVTRLLALDYPRDRFEIQICDDSTDAETIAICRRAAEDAAAAGFAVTRLERADRAGFKAGNLNAALARARGELVVIVDADCQLDPGILKCTVPYFLDDPRVAAVQTYFTHENAAANLLTRSLQEGFDVHQGGEQTSRSDADLWPTFMGSAGVWRRRAIEEAGGWPLGTGIEDVYLSTLVQIDGWKVKYTSECASSARLPETSAVCRRQWRRWALSNGILLRRLGMRIATAHASLEARLAGLSYLLAFLQHAAMAALMFLTWPMMIIVVHDPSLAWVQTFAFACFLAWILPLTLAASHAHLRLGRSWRWLWWTAVLLMFHQAALAVVNGRGFAKGLLGTRFERWTPSHGATPREFDLDPWLEAAAVASVASAIYLASSSGLWWMVYPPALWAFWTAAFLVGPLWLPASGRWLGRWLKAFPAPSEIRAPRPLAYGDER